MNSINPFQIKTPEGLTPEEAVNLFVDVFTDYQKIKAQGHTFIIGPRGIGKSMMLRYLQPDCQCIKEGKKVSIDQLDFLGFYIPLRNASFTKLSEFIRVENNAAHIINEHIMTLYFMYKVYSCLSEPSLFQCNPYFDDAAKHYYNDSFLPRLQESAERINESIRIHQVFEKMASIMEKSYMDAVRYVNRLSFSKEILPYNGPLYEYLDFVIPLMEELTKIPCFPQKTIFFLIDDAHCLSVVQTQVLNFWVSTRTSRTVSLKISSQYNYKHFYTITGSTIDTPHDYSEVDMTLVYTGKAKPKYKERVTQIIEKRLRNAGIDKNAEEFFPCDVEQEKCIRQISEEYYNRYDAGNGQGNKRGDDALRYSRPDYIKSLAGTAKSSSTYSYSGFEQLVHLSSGIVRYFLEPAHKMYAETLSKTHGSSVLEIPAAIQNEVIREEANRALYNDLPKYAVPDDPTTGLATIPDTYPKDDIIKLSNLIQALGGLFRQVLLSDRSERRVFSIAISDTPSTEVERILNLGIQLGYLHSSTIGRKDSRSGGRTRLYILNRRLSPIWNLDPTAFAGYLFIQSSLLEAALNEPHKLLRRLSNQEIQEDAVQLSMFNMEGEPSIVVESEE